MTPLKPVIALVALLMASKSVDVANSLECPAPPAKNGIDFSLPCLIFPVNPIAEADRRVYFDIRSASLSAKARATLDRQAAVLAQYPNIAIKIVGFADEVEVSTAAERAALADRRARAVAAYLEGAGLARASITAIGRDDLPFLPGVRDTKTLAAMRQAQTLVE